MAISSNGSQSVPCSPSSMWTEKVINANKTPNSPLLKRYPSLFVPLRRHATSIAEVSLLVPAFDSPLRQAGMAAATFNMTMTIIGGGVISIPLSCARSGLVPFTLLMMISAVAKDYSLYLLCSCARRTGSTSFGGVARAAVGPTLEAFATFAIFVQVTFMLIGMMVLNEGIWSPMVWHAIEQYKNRNEEVEQQQFENDTTLGSSWTTPTTTSSQDSLVLCVSLLLMLPFLLKKNSTSLRHICYINFGSICTMCAAMVYRSTLQLYQSPHVFAQNVKWFGNPSDVLGALPIILLAFICSYNMISVSCSLQKPTKERVKQVIHRSVLCSFIVMYIFGVSGYLWAYNQTNGNILLNFHPADPIVLFGRIGCSISTLFALPMTLLPSRDSLLSLCAQFGEITMQQVSNRRGLKTASNKEEERVGLLHKMENGHHISDDKNGQNGESNDVNTNPHKKIISKGRSMSFGSSISTTKYDTFSSSTKKTQQQIGVSPSPKILLDSKKQQQPQSNSTFQEETIHVITTVSILLACYMVAIKAPGVAIVWDFIGSSLSFLIQFVIPAICYLPLKRQLVLSSLTSSGHWLCLRSKSLFFTWYVKQHKCVGRRERERERERLESRNSLFLSICIYRMLIVFSTLGAILCTAVICQYYF